MNFEAAYGAATLERLVALKDQLMLNPRASVEDHRLLAKGVSVFDGDPKGERDDSTRQT
jgi:hypothetical protein